MFRPIESYTAVRAMTLNGTAYAAGEVIDREDIIHSRQSDALLSKKLIIVTPDPHGRKTKDWMPTPISTPAKFRKGPSGPTPPDVIVIDPAYPECEVGGTVQCVATGYPAGSDQTFLWESDSPTSFSVDQNGLVTGLAPGGGYVYASHEGTLYPGQVPVTVNPPAPQSVVMSPDTATLQGSGDTVQFTATVSPAGADQTVTWESMVPSQITIDANGLATAMVDQGGSTIIVRSTVDSNKQDSALVGIEAPAPPPVVTVFPTAHSQPAGVGDFLVNAYVEPPTATQQVTWEDPSGSFVLTPDATGPMTCGVAINAGVSGDRDLIARHVDDTSVFAICVVTATAAADPASLETEEKPPPKRRRKH